ncbi:hypothetical protein [Streptomyces aureus]|uniref:Uncharacterized protein n=1 Tax=Streptomyces aureus TaxID=193461 RepID=A0ABV4SYR5_9ACTN
MPTFEELLHIKLSPLQSAADDWTAMAVLLKKVADEAGSMRSLAQGTEWKGENASVTKPFVIRVSDEFTDAVTEAESLGNLLSSAHDKIKAARDDLKTLCENPPTGITIRPDGTLIASVQPQRMSHGDPVTVVTQDDFDALQGRIDAIIGRAAEADSTCSWGLWQLTKDQHEFGSTYYGSLKDAQTDARQAQTKTDSVEYTPPKKWGSGTIKPIAEFLSYRSWMGGGEALLHGDLDGAVQGAIGGTPAAAAGEASKKLEKGSILSEVRGKHHRPTFINKFGKFGGKIFGAPVAVVATAVDFYYTPPGTNKEPGDTHVNAPGQPGKVRYQ